MKIALFTSHLTGVSILNEFLADPNLKASVAAIATDDPQGNVCNAKLRLWKHGLRDELPAELLSTAKQFDVPIQTGRVNTAEYVTQLSDLGVQRIYVSCFGQKLHVNEGQVFEPFAGSIWNIHPAYFDEDWPNCEGRDAYDKLAASGKNCFRLVLHELVDEMDKGKEVISSPKIPIAKTDLPLDLMLKSAPVSAQLLRRAIAAGHV